ncbi:hypothetical protein [Streptomyces prasinopilosus]|uniref:hypothetical protein n=1 Tax=Streptomyces prasinopilosus TaxID=67344 RepID=UPI0006EB4769|nr:hypothetical protein [Streptomyces prasinopilosus]
MPSSTQPAQSTAWPEGVIARYLTVGGATVDVSHDSLYLDDTEPNVSTARCGGCGAYCNQEWRRNASVGFNDGSRFSDAQASEWAQEHAEKCRALHRETVYAVPLAERETCPIHLDWVTGCTELHIHYPAAA